MMLSLPSAPSPVVDADRQLDPVSVSGMIGIGMLGLGRSQQAPN